MFSKSDQTWLKDTFANKDDLIGLAKGSEIDDLRISFNDNLAKWKDDLFSKIDDLINSLKPTKEEQMAISGKISEHSDTLEDHETRIGKLEQVLEPKN